MPGARGGGPGKAASLSLLPIWLWLFSFPFFTPVCVVCCVLCVVEEAFWSLQVFLDGIVRTCL